MAERDKKGQQGGVKIEIVQKQNLIDIQFGLPPLLATNNLESVGKPDTSKLQILVSADAFSKIDQHAKSDLSKEIGGFLIGRPYEWEGQSFVEIITALKAETRSSSAVHFKFSHDTWIHTQETVRTKYPELHIVGWYHTHPRFAVFMSAQDLDIHRGFFRAPWHVALVLDPSQQEAGFFVWDNEDVQLADGYRIQYPANAVQSNHWQNPTLRTRSLIGTPERTLKEFYEVGCWHTRWQNTDRFLVKIKESAMASLRTFDANPTKSVLGICVGRMERNYNKTGPDWFVEVEEFKSSDTELRLRTTEGEYPEEQLLNPDLLEETVTNKPIGIYYIEDDQAKSLSFKARVSEFLSKTVKIILSGNSYQGITACSWKQIDGQTVERKIVKMINLEELSQTGIEQTMALIKPVINSQLSGLLNPGQTIQPNDLMGTDPFTTEKGEDS